LGFVDIRRCALILLEVNVYGILGLWRTLVNPPVLLWQCGGQVRASAASGLRCLTALLAPLRTGRSQRRSSDRDVHHAHADETASATK
jgi:hypothetical protein